MYKIIVNLFYDHITNCTINTLRYIFETKMIRSEKFLQ